MNFPILKKQFSFLIVFVAFNASMGLAQTTENNIPDTNEWNFKIFGVYSLRSLEVW